jgi:hypothetical protein
VTSKARVGWNATARTGPVQISVLLHASRPLHHTHPRAPQIGQPRHPYDNSRVAHYHYADQRRVEVVSDETKDLFTRENQDQRAKNIHRLKRTLHAITLRLELCEHDRHDGRIRLAQGSLAQRDGK